MEKQIEKLKEDVNALEQAMEEIREAVTALTEIVKSAHPDRPHGSKVRDREAWE